MYEEFTRNDFRTFTEWLSFIKAIGNAIPEESYLQWYASTHTLVIDIPNCDYKAMNKADKIIGEFF